MLCTLPLHSKDARVCFEVHPKQLCRRPNQLPINSVAKLYKLTLREIGPEMLEKCIVRVKSPLLTWVI